MTHTKNNSKSTEGKNNSEQKQNNSVIVQYTPSSIEMHHRFSLNSTHYNCPTTQPHFFVFIIHAILTEK